MLATTVSEWAVLIATLIGSLTAAIVAIIGAKQGKGTREKVEQSSEQIDHIDRTKLEPIKEAVNGESPK